MPAKPSRAAFGEALLDLGAKDERIVTLDADLSKSTMTVGFAKKYPGARSTWASPSRPTRIGIGAGLALTGHLRLLVRVLRGGPLRDDPDLGGVHQRQREDRRHAFQGIAIGEDGYSQMGIEDIACIRRCRTSGSSSRPTARDQAGHRLRGGAPGPLYLGLTRQNLEPVCRPTIASSTGAGCSCARVTT